MIYDFKKIIIVFYSCYHCFKWSSWNNILVLKYLSLYVSCSLHFYIYIWVPRLVSKSFFQLLLFETIVLLPLLFSFNVAAVSFVVLRFVALIYSFFFHCSYVKHKAIFTSAASFLLSHFSSSSRGALWCVTGAQHSYTPFGGPDIPQIFCFDFQSHNLQWQTKMNILPLSPVPSEFQDIEDTVLLCLPPSPLTPPSSLSLFKINSLHVHKWVA